MSSILSVSILYERDIVLARQRARQIAAALHFDGQDQTRIATAVSEIARNAFAYAKGGRVQFSVEGNGAEQRLVVVVSDDGPGIDDVNRILEGRYRSRTGMGRGIVGVRRLMDAFDIQSSPSAGTRVVLTKVLPRNRPHLAPDGIARVTDELARQAPLDATDETHTQNQELLRALDELSRRQEELLNVNRELEDTNRGVVALYAELEEKADHLRRADEIKSRFLSNMSHEFRTPVSSIQALTRLLLDRADGDLTPEQSRQVAFIRKAADGLAELVNDLLDLAKVESGKTSVQPADFDVPGLFATLRGMLKPLLVNDAVNLVFDDVEDLPPLRTDEAKVSQILRNFISNALKFTERGEVHVSAALVPGLDAIAFSVADTGIGIAPEDQDRIFEEFTQVDSRLQRHVKGTGLGLPLCRNLAILLGGNVAVESEPGCGSTFRAIIPTHYELEVSPEHSSWERDPDRIPILMLQYDSEIVLFYKKLLSESGCQILHAHSLPQAREALEAASARLLLLDLSPGGADGWTLLAESKRHPSTRSIPVVAVGTREDESKAFALGADAFFAKPLDRQRFGQTLTRLTAPETMRRILVVDDEEISRYLLRQQLTTAQNVVVEASNGAEALRLAHDERLHAICLDLTMPEQDGFDVIRKLKDDATTRDIPVIIVTSRLLDASERKELDALAAAVLSKDAIAHGKALAAVEQAIRDGGSLA